MKEGLDMYTQVEKTKENNSKAITNSVMQKKSSNTHTFQFVDNRPEAVTQRKLQEMAKSSPVITLPLQKASAMRGQTIQFVGGLSELPKDLVDIIDQYLGDQTIEDLYNIAIADPTKLDDVIELIKLRKSQWRAPANVFEIIEQASDNAKYIDLLDRQRALLATNR
ncbi:hypothetical protein [Okeania sp. SIO2B3]|uniref:hypothetical protein n=1 Tax=Okeania sp. SIO2B3 TaxID=2607784 RepID=UPI0013C287E6|nr:hypothetical protein [Okeania sp. SIO2B3]NET44629.1 hypothetical protein [Okeania sp. SIO2B3]